MRISKPLKDEATIHVLGVDTEEFEFHCYYCNITQSEAMDSGRSLRMEWINSIEFRMICHDCRIDKHGKILFIDESIEINIR